MDHNAINMQHAINIMERAKARNSVDMAFFQRHGITNDQKPVIVKTEEEFHECGNKACFAGHIALAPEFQAHTYQNYRAAVGYEGSPRLVNELGQYRATGADFIIATWLGIPVEWAERLIFEATCAARADSSGSQFADGPHCIYGVMWEDVTAEHVLKVLRNIQTHGLAMTLDLAIDQWEGTKWQFPKYTMLQLQESIKEHDPNNFD